jgi:CheY-like chemotaxis protein
MSVNARKSLLFVTDDKDLIEKIQKQVEGPKTRIVTATNHTEARLKLGAETFQYVLIDMEMNGLNLVSYVEYIRKKEHRRSVKDLVPIILFGEDPAEFQAHFCDFDLTSFLDKPINIDELKTKLSIMGGSSVLKDYTRTIEKNTVLVKEGTSSLEMYWVLNGTFVTTKKLQDSEEEQVIGKIKVGELIGEMSFLDSQKRSASVTALEDSEVLVIPYKKFFAAMDGQPRWLQTLMKTLSNRLRVANDIISKNQSTLQTMSDIQDEVDQNQVESKEDQNKAG